MKRLGYLFLLVICFFIGNVYVKAESCELEDFERLKSLANNITINYEYVTEENLYNNYYVFINGLTNEFYINDGRNNYYYDEFENGNLTLLFTSGNFDFSVYSANCSDILLRTVSVKLPTYNVFSDSDECKKMKEYNLEVCDPWYQGSLNVDEFEKIIAKYEKVEEQKIKDASKKYWLIGGVCIIVFVLLFIIFLVRRKRSVLE